MLAFLFVIGVFYLALNSGLESKSVSHKSTQQKAKVSYKDHERYVDDAMCRV